MERGRYMNEPTLHHVLDAISTLSAKTDERFEEVFEALHEFSSSVDQRFVSIDQRFDSMDQRFIGMEQRFDGMEKRFDGMEQRVDGLDRRLVRLENQMVTKSYLDDKLADLSSDLVRRWRTEDDLVVARLERKFGK